MARSYLFNKLIIKLIHGSCIKHCSLSLILQLPKLCKTVHVSLLRQVDENNLQLPPNDIFAFRNFDLIFCLWFKF